MENDSSDAKFIDEGNGIDLTDESQPPLKPENTPIKTPNGGQDSYSNAKTTQNSADKDKKVAEKVEGDTIPQTHPDSYIACGGGPTNNGIAAGPENLVREWESLHPGITLSRRARELALLAASFHLHERRGITVGDLEKLRLGKDNAEMKLFLSKKNNLLVPHKTLRKGKQKQYFLPNYIHTIDAKANHKKKEIIPDEDLVIRLLQVLSSRKYTYHDIHMETSLNYRDDYSSINWPVLSGYNKQKVKTFNLESLRKCSITVSPTGTVNIAFECTLHPYKLHTPSDLVAFFGSCGLALGELQGGANNKINLVPSISEWYLTQLDYNKDIPSGDPTVLSWAPVNGRLRIEYLGVVFQIYPKGMPELGECIRIEGHYRTNKKERLVDKIGDIVGGGGGGGGNAEGEKKLPFVTAEELLSNIRENGNKSDTVQS
jgi:hypothetical protein